MTTNTPGIQFYGEVDRTSGLMRVADAREGSVASPKDLEGAVPLMIRWDVRSHPNHPHLTHRF